MNRRRTMFILLLAIGSALLAGFAAKRYTDQRPSTGVKQAEGGSMQVVVAARDLPVGHLITEADVQVIRWPAGALPAGYIPQPSAAVGRGLIQSIRMNTPLLETILAEPGSGAGLRIRIPEGMRAISVRVDDVVAVAGYVGVDTRVDVLLTIKPLNGAQTYTQTILQNLTVLAVGQTDVRDEQGKPFTASVVTLMVTPYQSEKLVLAAAQGRIQLALRNMLDMDDAQTTGIGDARLLDLSQSSSTRVASTAAPVRRAVATDSATVIEVFKGGVRSLQRF